MIALFMLLFLIQFAIYGIGNIIENGIYHSLRYDYIPIVFFFIFLAINLWILTATFLPIIKINKFGITAYSILWKRSIKWEEIQSVKLLKMSTRGGAIGSAAASFELTKLPEKKSTLSNKGFRVATYILISKSNKSIKSFSKRYQLLTHHKMTNVDEIAFEFDPQSWEIINEKINKK